jgi:alkylation response protein AidB-like acyl-CoA dehydrogenase
MKRAPDSEVHQQFRRSVRAFLEREVLPRFEEWEHAGLVDRELFRRAGAAGFLGMSVPEEFGGGGVRDYRFTVILTEEFCAAGVLNAGQGLMNQNDVVIPYLSEFGTVEQKTRWLPGLCCGSSIAGIAMTEPDTGSDLRAIQTRAVRDGDLFEISGSKVFITNGVNGDLFVVACKIAAKVGRDEPLSLFVVEAETPGFRRGRRLSKVGQHAIDTGELFFDGVKVPVANLLGEECRAFYHLMSMLPRERLSIAVTAVAHAQTAFEWTLKYCKDRHAFGQPIGSFQNSRFVLATMRTELDIAQVFVDRQVDLLNAGELTAEDAAEAKWWCTDLNKRVLDHCLQLHGGNGYMEEYPIARAWRDGRAMSIYGGTNEIMKEIIGRRVLGV